MKQIAVRLLGSAVRWSTFKAGIVLCYHGTAEENGDPVREIVPAHGRRDFEGHLDLLARRYDVVPASRIFDAISERRPGQRFPVAITFDDDLSSHATIAAPALADRGLPATFFLSGASLDQPFAFWWERLQHVLDNGLPLPGKLGVASNTSALAIADVVRTMPAKERADIAEEMAELLGGDPASAGIRAGQVRAIAEQGFELGFHTLDHETLTALGDAELASAVVVGRDALERVSGQRLSMIAYPFGAADARVGAAAEAAGYTLGFVLWGITRSDAPRFLVPRLTAPFGPPDRLDLAITRTLIGAYRRSRRDGSR